VFFHLLASSSLVLAVATEEAHLQRKNIKIINICSLGNLRQSKHKLTSFAYNYDVHTKFTGVYFRY
jgi:hypothetical protein